MNVFLKEYNERINQLLISQLFFYCLEIELFTKLEEFSNLDSLSESLNISNHDLKEILTILVGYDYIYQEDVYYYNTPSTKKYLSKVSDDYIGDVVLSKLKLVNLDNIGLFTKERVSLKVTIDFKELARSKEKEIKYFRADDFKDNVERLYTKEDKIKILDLGCGNGMISMKLLESNRNAKTTLYDQDYVLEVARDNVKKYDLVNQVEIIEGNFMNDCISEGYDIIIASGVLDFAGEKISELIKKLYSALNEGGYLFVYSLHFSNTKEEIAKSKLQWLSTTLKSYHVAKKFDINDIIVKGNFTLVHQTSDGVHPLNIYRK